MAKHFAVLERAVSDHTLTEARRLAACWPGGKTPLGELPQPYSGAIRAIATRKGIELQTGNIVSFGLGASHDDPNRPDDIFWCCAGFEVPNDPA
jgi:hypothetical protein